MVVQAMQEKGSDELSKAGDLPELELTHAAALVLLKEVRRNTRWVAARTLHCVMLHVRINVLNDTGVSAATRHLEEICVVAGRIVCPVYHTHGESAETCTGERMG